MKKITHGTPASTRGWPRHAKGVTTTLDKAAADARDGTIALDPEAWDGADAAVLSLMTEMDDRTLTFVAAMWAQRLAFSED